MRCKFLTVCGLFIALSHVGHAAETSCSGNRCGKRAMGPVMSGSRPLSTEEFDTCRGTVKCVNRTEYPNGSKSEMVIITPEGEKKVLMDSDQVNGVLPNQNVEIKGRNVESNGQTLMMGASLSRQGTSLNSSVRSGN